MATRRRKPAATRKAKAPKKTQPSPRKAVNKPAKTAVKKPAKKSASRVAKPTQRLPATKRRTPTKPSRALPRPTQPATTSNATKESPLDDEMMSDLAYFDGRALRLLFPKRRPAEALKIVEAIRDYVDDVRDGRREAEPDLALTLSCLWGAQVCRTLGWTWARVAYADAAGTSIGIVSPDRAYAIFPFHFLKDVLENGDRSNTTLLLFNMLCAGSLPISRAGTYAAIS